MEKREPKDLTIYRRRFDEDPSSFNDFQAMDYVRELKNHGLMDDAIEVGRTFLQIDEGLTGFINYYGYALYNKFINIDEKSISEKENLFYSIVDEILSITKQEKYSPFEATINKVTRHILNTKPVDYAKLASYLDKLDVVALNGEPFINKEGREFESKKEKWYRLRVRSAYETGDYAKCVEASNMAFSQPLKWHYNNQNWIKYYRASALVKLERYEEAENEFLALGNRIPTGDAFEVLYSLYMNTGREKEAYQNLVYKFFNEGYGIDKLDIYEKVLDMVKTGKNTDTIALANALVYKLKEENGMDVSENEIDEAYANRDSSSLYDRFYNQLMEHLDDYIDRKEGRVAYYNSDKEFGSIYVHDEDNLFFRQSDYIYDEEVEKRDVVEYSVMKTYDAKKQRPSTKAILLKTIEQARSYD
ncbi:MAG: hypothetical protein LUG46_02820 [Erysipelotrichaceae bacterium]|nr:hypothetical protein [Erysipelotrichaceae bacterium]